MGSTLDTCQMRQRAQELQEAAAPWTGAGAPWSRACSSGSGDAPRLRRAKGRASGSGRYLELRLILTYVNFACKTYYNRMMIHAWTLKALQDVEFYIGILLWPQATSSCLWNLRELEHSRLLRPFVASGGGCRPCAAGQLRGFTPRRAGKPVGAEGW